MLSTKSSVHHMTQQEMKLRNACFDYLSPGRHLLIWTRLLTLSGLNPSPLVLIFRFFSVAIYGVGRLILPFPSPNRLWMSARLIWDASSIITLPIIKAEGVRQMFFPQTVPAYYRARSPPVFSPKVLKPVAIPFRNL
ncbi:unnamed protein product [Rhodiola kirilowii]